jgi:hypothetical protein
MDDVELKRAHNAQYMRDYKKKEKITSSGKKV